MAIPSKPLEGMSSGFKRYGMAGVPGLNFPEIISTKFSLIHLSPSLSVSLSSTFSLSLSQMFPHLPSNEADIISKGDVPLSIHEQDV